MPISFNKILQYPGFYFFFVKIRPYAGKYAFLILCIVSLIWYTFHTRTIIKKIQDDAVGVTQTYAELIRSAISANMDYREMNVIFEEIIQKSNNPIIITDTAWNPLLWKNITAGTVFRRTYVSSDDTSLHTRRYLERQVAEFKKMFEPKPLYISETQIKIGYLVFGYNNLVGSLKWIPVLGTSVVAAFILFAYLAFHSVRVTERGNLWVGLAKETAHQLGTPISSLMGWVEYMKEATVDNVNLNNKEFLSQIRRICLDMEHDLTRLKKITNRFNQIGSAPTLAPCDINAVVEEAKNYLAVRMPVLRRRISIETSPGTIPMVEANRDLLEWIFENLMKNSIDAIHHDDGRIEIRTEYVQVNDVVRIYVSDNGSGILWEDQKRIFTPGYTTKKRGWGLGLTLAKRIVDDYHSGSIRVERSQRDKGTVFCIELPVKQHIRTKIRQGVTGHGRRA